MKKSRVTAIAGAKKGSRQLHPDGRPATACGRGFAGPWSTSNVTRNCTLPSFLFDLFCFSAGGHSAGWTQHRRRSCATQFRRSSLTCYLSSSQLSIFSGGFRPTVFADSVGIKSPGGFMRLQVLWRRVVVHAGFSVHRFPFRSSRVPHKNEPCRLLPHGKVCDDLDTRVHRQAPCGARRREASCQ